MAQFERLSDVVEKGARRLAVLERQIMKARLNVVRAEAKARLAKLVQEGSNQGGLDMLALRQAASTRRAQADRLFRKALVEMAMATARLNAMRDSE